MFTLKGKPLKVWDLKRDIVYKNDEMHNFMRALDIEDNIEGLRYDKVILATHAHVDGLHIRVVSRTAACERPIFSAQ